MPTALLVIDVQQVLCSGAPAAFEAERVIDRINAVSRKARAARTPVIVIQHETQGTGEMDYGSDAWKLAPSLETQKSDIYIRKTTPDSFHRTELQGVLQAHRISNLVICGMQSEFCVDSTTRRALAIGYPVVLVSDGHTTMDNGVLSAAQIIAHHNATLACMDSFGPRVRPIAAAEVTFDA